MKHHKLFFAIIFSFLMPFCATAQVQQGYVKTRGRLGSDGAVIPGEGIENVTVKVKNEGTVISDNSGCFEIALRNEKYYLENVTKKGYLLVDADILSKQYTRSVDTFKIVLTTPEQQLEDELAGERKLRRTLTRQLQQREDEIEELYETSKIIKAERDSALRKLYADHADNEKLIKDMVERYSRIDYDQLDEFNRRISEYILNGELLKADSMINSKGDIHSRIEEYRTHKQLNDDERAELAEREKDLAKSEELERKKLSDLAADCYSKFEIFKLQHLNDSAAYYIELRASLDDSTNVEWLLDAGMFIDEYIADYDNAISYYNLALNSALKFYGEKSKKVSTCYNNIGLLNYFCGEYSVALEYYDKAIEIDSCSAMSYLNVGLVHSDLDHYDEALKSYFKSLSLLLAEFGEKHRDVALVYNNIGVVYQKSGSYTKAMEYAEKSLEIRLAIYKEEHYDIAFSYYNIGYLYYCMGENDKALEYYDKALNIWMKNFGGKHPDIAMCYAGFGVTHFANGNHQKALEYMQKSLEIYQAVYGAEHPRIGECYNNIAYILNSLNEKYKALEYYDRSYGIMKKYLPEDNWKVKTIKNRIDELKSETLR